MSPSMSRQRGDAISGRFPVRGNVSDALSSECDTVRRALGGRDGRLGRLAANLLAEQRKSRRAAPVLVCPVRHGGRPSVGPKASTRLACSVANLA
jgi:hypothetical protein